MSAFEQRREIPNKAFQYLVVSSTQSDISSALLNYRLQLAAEPYETIAFAIPSKEMVDVDEDPESTWEHWDADEKVYSCQFLYK